MIYIKNVDILLFPDGNIFLTIKDTNIDANEIVILNVGIIPLH